VQSVHCVRSISFRIFCSPSLIQFALHQLPLIVSQFHSKPFVCLSRLSLCFSHLNLFILVSKVSWTNDSRHVTCSMTHVYALRAAEPCWWSSRSRSTLCPFLILLLLSCSFLYAFYLSACSCPCSFLYAFYLSACSCPCSFLYAFYLSACSCPWSFCTHFSSVSAVVHVNFCTLFPRCLQLSMFIFIRLLPQCLQLSIVILYAFYLSACSCPWSFYRPFPSVPAVVLVNFLRILPQCLQLSMFIFIRLLPQCLQLSMVILYAFYLSACSCPY